MRTVFAVTLASLVTIAGCGPSVVGRPCDSTDPCPAHFTCAMAHDGTNRCMRDCALDETVCSDGTACLPIGSSSLGGACYLGGNAGVGQSCTNDLDCTRTAICIGSSTAPGAPRECRVGCNIDGTHGCNGGFFCQPTTTNAGFCAQTM
jgi:hypothetical protein